MTNETFLPVVLVTVKTDSASRVEGLKIGADDYVCKPFEEKELVARVEAMLRIKRLHDHVAAARQKLERMSVHDELTGLYNYRYLHTRLTEEFKRAERYHDPLACAFIDIDQLEGVQRAGGRPLGDHIIRAVADAHPQVRARRRRRGALRRRRVFGRAAEHALRRRGDRGRAHLARGDREALHRRRRASTTPSRSRSASGLYPSRDVRTKDALVRAADGALQQAKRDGGNRICVFQQQGYIYTPAIGRQPSRRARVRSGGRNSGGGR